MNCQVCSKPIRSISKYGYCVAHRNEAPEIKAYKQTWGKKEENLEKKRIYSKDNYERRISYMQEYAKKNADSLKDYKKEYAAANKSRRNEADAQRRKIDIIYRLRGNLRTRLRQAIKGNTKNGSSVKDLGCTIVELKAYLESKFLSGMSWDNWTSSGWHIDHIKALSKFDLSDPEQFSAACHYTNLQPLWAVDNIKKSNR